MTDRIYLLEQQVNLAMTLHTDTLVKKIYAARNTDI